MHFKVLLMLLLIGLVHLDNAEGKKKRGKKPSGNNVAICKKTHIDNLDTHLSTQLSEIKTETQNCCTKNEEDDTLQVNIEDIKSNVTKTIEKLNSRAEETQIEMKTDMQRLDTKLNDFKAEVNNKVEKVFNKVDEIKDDVALIKDHLERMKNNSRCETTGTTTDNTYQTTWPPFTTPSSVALAHDCSDNKQFTGVKTIQPLGQDPFNVTCSGECVYMARRFDGSVDFYRGWTEYQAGFGNPGGEYFIGLDNLHGLLNRGNYKLRVELTMWPPQSESRHAEYSIFDVSDEHDNYRLTVGGYSGDAGDSLAYHNGMAFTTKDRDHDKRSNNCAVQFKGAWWYKDCYYSNLFGLYNTGPKCPVNGECVAWSKWPNKIASPFNSIYSFKKIDMKVCPK